MISTSFSLLEPFLEDWKIGTELSRKDNVYPKMRGLSITLVLTFSTINIFVRYYSQILEI